MTELMDNTHPYLYVIVEGDSDYAPSLDEPDSDDVEDEDFRPSKRLKPKPACAKARDARREKERSGKQPAQGRTRKSFILI